jgi:Tfp pilus assembly protein PilF
MHPERLRGSVRPTAVVLGLWLCGCAHQPTPASAAARAASRDDHHFVSPFAYEWFVRAELQRARGNLEAAIAGYRAVLADADDDPYVLSRLASALDEHGQHAQAQASLDQALQTDPCSEAAWLTRAQLAERAGQLEAAFAAYERAESCTPWSPRAPLALAQLLQAHGQPERASAVLARVQTRALPGSAAACRARLALALAQNDATAAINAAQAWLRLEQAAEQPLRSTVEHLLASDKPQLALQLLQALPDRPQWSALRLRALVACGHFAAAEALLTISDPETLGGLVETARSALAIGRAQAALELTQDALATNPQDWQAQLVQAQAELSLSDYVAAASGFSALATSPLGGAEARAGLALALRAQGLFALADEVARPTAQ